MFASPNGADAAFDPSYAWAGIPESESRATAPGDNKPVTQARSVLIDEPDALGGGLPRSLLFRCPDASLPIVPSPFGA